MVFKKIDLVPDFQAHVTNLENLFVSAKENINIDQLIDKIKEKIFADKVCAKLMIPYTRGDLSSYLCEKALVKSCLLYTSELPAPSCRWRGGKGTA